MEFLQIDENLRLERPAPHHADEALTLIQENLHHLKPWMPWAVDDYSMDHTMAWIERSKDSFDKDGTFGLLILFHGKIVGALGIHDLDKANKRTCIGYWTDHRHQGKGIVTRCCMALITYCFVTMGLNRVQINCNVENKRSRAVPERLGFTLEGTMRQAEFLNGEFRDWAIYSLLANDRRVW